MSKPLVELHTAGGSLTIGGLPRVVGTLTSWADAVSGHRRDWPCDIVEVRLDQMPRHNDWLERCRAIEAIGLPVLLTPRHVSEGGKWAEDAVRLEIFQSALENLSAVDVELDSQIAIRVTEMAKKAGKVCVVSHHNFDRTPELTVLEAVLSRMQKIASVAKISAMIREPKDIAALQSLLQKKGETPMCIIGMGTLGAPTRVSFSTEGSCLTYGYLGSEPAAPGQLSAAELMEQLRQLVPEYDADVRARKG